MATISEALAIALQHHQAGQLPQTEQIYRQILEVEPNHADAWHLLGVLAHKNRAKRDRACPAVAQVGSLNDTSPQR
jgi:hypothetical protein